MKKYCFISGVIMRAWYFIHKFIRGVALGMLCGGIFTFLLALSAVVCIKVLT